MEQFAEDVGHYWKTSKSSPDVWIDRAKKQVEKLGGIVLAEGFGNEPLANHSAYMLAFKINDDHFKVVWPVLPSRTDNEKAARVQAATMLYHDIKAKSISSAVLGIRAAFLSFLVLPTGQSAGEMSTPELLRAIPSLFAPRLGNRH